MEKYFTKKNIQVGVISFLIFAVSFAGSYFGFRNLGSSKSTTGAPTAVRQQDGQVVFDDALPRTEECPLNGQLYSKQQKEWWENHRPLGIMIENHEETRPQSGLSSADVVYEAVAEGGITRFLSIFYCEDAGIVGPIRSARTYFLDWISEYGSSPLYVHVGGANQPGPADALSQIDNYGWEGENDINQFSVGFPTFWRDYNRLGKTLATEHTMYSTTQKLWDYAKKDRKLSKEDSEGTHWSEGFVSYEFKDEAKASERGGNQTVHLEFWSEDPRYLVDWKYDNVTNSYKRNNGGKPHMDKNNNKQISVKNLVVLFMQERRANDGYPGNLHLLYRNKGSGEGTVFMDGKKIDVTWRKNNRTGRTLLFDSKGKQIEFNRGKIWFSILPLEGEADVR